MSPLIIFAVLIMLCIIAYVVMMKIKEAQKRLLGLDPSDPNTVHFEMKKVDGTIQLVHVPHPVEEKKSPPRDPLDRYRRRYGLCGQFSRITRKSRRERAKRALQDAIRTQDVERLKIFYAIGIS